MLDLHKYSPNLESDPNGVWYARNSSPIDYPEQGNAFCYQVEDGSFWFNHRNTIILAALKRFPPPGEIFDIGGGNGFVSLSIRQAGFVTVLVEPGFEGIQNARRRGLDNLVQASLQDAGFHPASLPAVGIFDVLEHIQDDVSFLGQIAQLLIPGGLLYLTVPAYSSLWSSEDTYAGHYRRYTLAQLKSRLSQAGFTIELATYFFVFLLPAIFLFRTLPSKMGLRTQGDTSFTQAELQPPSPLVNRLLNLASKVELTAFQRLKFLPFGGSCLVVARADHHPLSSPIS